jgi:hypothetical protein
MISIKYSAVVKLEKTWLGQIPQKEVLGGHGVHPGVAKWFISTGDWGVSIQADPR